MSPRKPTGQPNGRPPKSARLTYFLVGDFSLTFDEAKAGIDRAIKLMSRKEYREYMERLSKLGPDMVEKRYLEPDTVAERPLDDE